MTDVVYCNRCGTQNSALAKFCANCGSPFGAENSTAAVLGAEVTPRPQGPADPASAATPAAQSLYTAPVYSSPAHAVRYGGFWIRFVAAVIDTFALGIVVGPVAGILALMIGAVGGRVDMPGVGIHLVLGIVIRMLFLLAGWIYEASMESSSRQATLGKMALGLKVTDEYGNRISFARASARFFSKILSSMILMIGYIMAGFTARKQALHDMIAGTLVVRTQ
jgi:uncharacterized RDD family membrane protein YckC